MRKKAFASSLTALYFLSTLPCAAEPSVTQQFSSTAPIVNAPDHLKESTWELVTSTLTYNVHHKFNDPKGRTTAAKGSGVCKEEGCEFRVSAPVKTFDSGDQNRDIHMLRAVKGPYHPMVTVRAKLKSEPKAPGFKSDLMVDFAGKAFRYSAVEIDVTNLGGSSIQIEGTIPLELHRHDVTRPSLLGVPIKDGVPVRFETTWKRVTK